ncbi:PilZ domain-containing protein [Sphingomonas sp. RT2P30]|uniref:PilZ domain-containing protein n=1 Tax=Parasphingomonas halimpatiens TaxID=3096162 RepID=UPI002FCCAF50
MFAAEIRIVPQGDASFAPNDARREDRSPVVVPGRINDLGARSLCRVADLSVSGARLQTHACLTVGSPVMVTLPGQKPRPATIVWADGFIAGCEFATPLAQDLLDLLVAMYRFTPADPALLQRPN